MKLLLVAGARPNFMKIAPLVHAIQRHNERLQAAASGSVDSPLSAFSFPLSYVLVHTGQHYDEKMSDVFFRELGIPAPQVNLEVGSGSHAAQTAQLMLKFEPVLLAEKPDWVVVVGDVNSTMACTLVSAKLGVKVAHVEAGLRSFDRTMPEEINRLVTDAIADLLLTPSTDADEHLQREGVAPHKIQCVGNIMIDSLVVNLEQARASRILQTCAVEPGRFIYVTLHRPANVDHRESLAALVAELGRLSAEFPIVFPMHPRTRKMIQDFAIPLPPADRLKVIEPVGYHDSLCLTENARLVLTDSGGLQEESTYFRTPCLTLRPNTERPVTVTVGSNKLTDLRRLRSDWVEVLAKPLRFGTIPPLWDGQTAGRVLDALCR